MRSVHSLLVERGLDDVVQDALLGFSPAVLYLQELDEKNAVVLIMGWWGGSYYVVCSPVG